MPRIPKNLLNKKEETNLLPLDLVVRFLTDPHDLTALSQVNKKAYSIFSELKFQVIRGNKKESKAEPFTMIIHEERRQARTIRYLSGCNHFFQCPPIKLTPTLLSLAVGAFLLKESYLLVNRLERHHSISRDHTAFSFLLATALISYAVYWLAKNILNGASYIFDNEHQYRLHKQKTNPIKEMKLETANIRNK